MMNHLVNFTLLASTLLSSQVGAKVIYGKDNRHEVYAAKAVYQKLALSTPTMIPVKNMNPSNKDGSTDLLQTTFQEWLESQGDDEESEKQLLSRIKSKDNDDDLFNIEGLFSEEDFKLSFCKEERFIEQPNPGMCSGFLIAPDLVVTAGHCAEMDEACEGYNWVFDFKVDKETGQSGVGVKPENIYSCKKIITKSLNMSLSTDYAIIQLDRKVLDRAPLEIRYDGVIKDKTELVIIGNPSGLPLKVTDNAKVRDNSHLMFFSANLDTFQGNSGSAVFNAETGVVEGILVRGEEDFSLQEENLCLEAFKCEDDGCRGEDVSRITSIPEIALKNILHAAAEEGDTETLEKILSLNTWVDFYGADGQSALMKAAAAGQNDSVVTLIAHGADVNLTDAKGNTALHHLAPVLKPWNSDVLRTLLAAKANLKARNHAGKTPSKVARSARNFRGYMMLIKARVRRNRY